MGLRNSNGMEFIGRIVLGKVGMELPNVTAFEESDIECDSQIGAPMAQLATRLKQNRRSNG